MAKVYFYKFNINSDIYNVYENSLLQDEILWKVYAAINSEITAKIKSKDENEEEREIEYKFCDIDKDLENMIVTGRLVKIFNGEAQSYDRQNDTVKTAYEEDRAYSATFCFDIRHEEIAFITRQGLKYLQFGRMFKVLLEKSFPEDSFELVLEKNVGELKDKVYALERVLKVRTEIIPPNANESEFRNLLGASVEEFKETKATKYIQGMEIPAKSKKSIDPHTTFFERMFYATGKGYAKMYVEGKNEDNISISVDSDEDTPYKDVISEKEKDSILAFKERALIVIAKLLRNKEAVTFRRGVIEKEKE